jgi:hypothetical protein
LPQPAFPAAPRNSDLDDLYQAERSALDGYSVIPLFHLPVASAVSLRVRGGAPDRLGAWNEAGHSLADVWLADQRRTDSRADPRANSHPQAASR